MPVKPTSDSVVPPSVSNMSSLADPSSGPSSLLTTSNQTPLSALGHEDSSPSSLASQHNKYDVDALWHFFILLVFLMTAEMLMNFVAFQLPPNTAEQFDTFSSHFKHKSTGEFALHNMIVLFSV